MQPRKDLYLEPHILFEGSLQGCMRFKAKAQCDEACLTWCVYLHANPSESGVPHREALKDRVDQLQTQQYVASE